MREGSSATMFVSWLSRNLLEACGGIRSRSSLYLFSREWSVTRLGSCSRRFRERRTSWGPGRSADAIASPKRTTNRGTQLALSWNGFSGSDAWPAFTYRSLLTRLATAYRGFCLNRGQLELRRRTAILSCQFLDAILPQFGPPNVVPRSRYQWRDSAAFRRKSSVPNRSCTRPIERHRPESPPTGFSDSGSIPP